MHLDSLSLVDFRNLADLSLTLDPAGTTLVIGPNGVGKTSVLEAVGYLSNLRSFRSAPREAMVRRGAQVAVIRAQVQGGDRSVTIEAELAVTGRPRTMVNRQLVRRRSDLHGAFRTTTFSPLDVAIVREGPAERRAFLDDVLASLDPKLARHVDELERILRQRAALLRDAHGRSTSDVDRSLEVWDERLDETGTRVAEAREELLEQLQPRLAAGYDHLADRPSAVTARYVRSWHGRLSDALTAHRRADVVRGTTSVGPHRDDVELAIDGLPARTHASQGEQRSLALSLRLSAHQLATDRTGEPPVLLLDDVFSELDEGRRRTLVEGLSVGQALVTSTTGTAPGVAVARVVELVAGDGTTLAVVR